VLSVYRAHGFGLLRRDLREGWSTLMLRGHGG
jgi:hypothetical protein